MPVDSFSINHLTLKEGIYKKQDSLHGCFTYDIRLVAPCKALYSDLGGAVLHTLEHFFASIIRNNTKFSNSTIYIGPMGCRTGFYFIFSRNYSCKEIQQVVVEVFNYILSIDIKQGSRNVLEPFAEEIPGATQISCGNPTYFDLEQTQDVVRLLIDLFSDNNLPKVYEQTKSL